MTIAWRGRTTPWANFGECLKVQWNPTLGQFLAVGIRFPSGGATAATSTDSVTWTSRNTALAPATSAWGDFAWSESLGIYLAVGNDGGLGVNQAFSSPDGITWTGRGNILTSPAAAGSIIWVEELGLFIAAGGNNATWPSPILATSPDGTTWTTRTTPWDGTGGFGGGGGVITNLAWNPVSQLIVAGGLRTSGGADIYTSMTSPDGINWTSRPAYFTAFFEALDWSDLFQTLLACGAVSGGGGSAYAKSDDGINWTALTALSTAASNNIADESADCFHELAIYALRSGGGDFYTDDLSTGTKQLVGITGSVCWSEDLGVAVLAGLGSGLQPTKAIYVSVPIVDSGPATGECSTAILGAGTITPNTSTGDPITWYYDWGTTTGLGTHTPGGTVSGLDDVSVSDTIGGLTAGVTYYYQLVAVHGPDISVGSLDSFVEGDDCPDSPTLNAEFAL